MHIFYIFFKNVCFYPVQYTKARRDIRVIIERGGNNWATDYQMPSEQKMAYAKTMEMN